MSTVSSSERYQQLYALTHQRRLEPAEIDELSQLAQELGQPNPLAPTLASVFTKILVLNQNNEALILWRSQLSPMPGRADFPGGGLDFGEHPDDGAKRELEEEVGLVADSVQLLNIYNSVHHQQFLLRFGYLTRINQPQVTLSWEHDRFAWLPINQALEVDTLPEHHKQLLRLV
jgi:mutator protein MutT